MIAKNSEKQYGFGLIRFDILTLFHHNITTAERDRVPSAGLVRQRRGRYPPPAGLFGRLTGVLWVALQPFERLLGFGERPVAARSLVATGPVPPYAVDIKGGTNSLVGPSRKALNIRHVTQRSQIDCKDQEESH